MSRITPKKKTDPPKRQRVLIVDDHPFVRMGLTESLAGEPGIMVCGAAATAEEALAALDTLHPDIVVTDLTLPGKSGLELVKDLTALKPDLRIIVLSMHDEDIYAERCLRAGAHGYVMKTEGPEKLAAAIRRVLGGEVYVSPKTSARLLRNFAGGREPTAEKPLAQLTDREFEIFQWMGRGLSTREVAERLHLSAKTVETHRVHIKRKLHITSAVELSAFAVRWVVAGA